MYISSLFLVAFLLLVLGGVGVMLYERHLAHKQREWRASRAASAEAGPRD